MAQKREQWPGEEERLDSGLAKTRPWPIHMKTLELDNNQCQAWRVNLEALITEEEEEKGGGSSGLSTNRMLLVDHTSM